MRRGERMKLNRDYRAILKRGAWLDKQLRPKARLIKRTKQ